MTNGEIGRFGTGGENKVRPLALAAGIVGYGASVILLLTLIARLIVQSISGLGALFVWLLAVVAFALGAGLSRYSSGARSSLLAALAGAYALIAAMLMVLAAFDSSEADMSAASQILVVLFLAFTAIVMSVVTANVAQLPVRRLAIPYIFVALALLVVATMVVIGVDLSTPFGDNQLTTLGRLVISLVACASTIAWLLNADPGTSGGRWSMPTTIGLRSRRGPD